MSDKNYMISIDQGTTSSRVILFDRQGQIVCDAQKTHEQIVPRPGWLEHDPDEIFSKVQLCLSEVAQKMSSRGIAINEIGTVGITCQRETTVIWDRMTGVPLYNAIVWSDTRTASVLPDLELACKKQNISLPEMTGLALSTYFSGPKVRWMIDNEEKLRKALCEDKTAIIGTIDTWLLYKLTQYNPDGPSFKTDVTNASRTLMFNCKKMQWDQQLCDLFGVPMSALPEVCPTSYNFANVSIHPFKGIPVCSLVGDQQASLFGHGCVSLNSCKCTFGTGAFFLTNIGENFLPPQNGLITTVGYQLDGQAPVYAFEGSIAQAGSTLEWLISMGVLVQAKDVDGLLQKVEDTGGVVFIPAFSGLFAPRWRPDARGTILGITQHTRPSHLVKAACDAICMQVEEIRDIVGAQKQLCVDGGITKSRQFLNLLSQICEADVMVPSMVEVTALGAALLAGLASGMYKNLDEVTAVATQEREMIQEQPSKHVLWLRSKWNELIPRCYNLAVESETEEIGTEVE